MKHVFVVNPLSGKGVLNRELISELDRMRLDYYLTKRAGDGENYIRETCMANPSEKIRFYACGGDGTLHEAVNGIFGFENAEAACVPIGSGNDFIRNFGMPAENFKDIGRQLSGNAVNVDVIKYQGAAGGPAARYAVNMFNIGFDCNVVIKTAEIKKYPFIKGPFAYFLSILIMLVKKEGADITIDFDDGASYRGRVLLTAIGNGAFCGGGLKGVPRADVSDGLIDVCIVKNVSRRVFISLFGKYPSGEYIEDKKAKDIVIYKKCKSLTVKNREPVWNLCVDGEIETAGEARFEIIPNAIRFSLPSV